MRGAIVTVILGAALWAYLAFAAGAAPNPILNIIAIPAVLGLVAYVAVVGSRQWVLWLAWLPFLVSAAPLLAMPGDPAKPGLQWILYGPMLVSIFAGELIAWAISRLFRLKVPGGKPHA